MKIKYLKLAKLEFHDAISYYEMEQKGLGRKFELDIKYSINRIKRFPNAYVKIQDEIRKCVLHKFPFNIVYSIEENHIIIIAIAHHHRIPDYWVDRII